MVVWLTPPCAIVVPLLLHSQTTAIGLGAFAMLICALTTLMLLQGAAGAFGTQTRNGAGVDELDG
jgi:hypothetical protein